MKRKKTFLTYFYKRLNIYFLNSEPLFPVRCFFQYWMDLQSIFYRILVHTIFNFSTDNLSTSLNSRCMERHLVSQRTHMCEKY